MVQHWDEIQAGRPPRDPVLIEAERRFFDAALVNPNDPSAINGLANVRWCCRGGQGSATRPRSRIAR